MTRSLVVATLLTLTIFTSQFANAALIRVSDGTVVTDLSTESSTVWNIGEDGELTDLLLGAFNVDVDGVLYDVTFREESFDDIFGGVGGLDANSLTEARRFSVALVEKVFVDFGADLFGSQHDRIFGIDSPVAFVLTPYALGSDMFGDFAISSAADHSCTGCSWSSVSDMVRQPLTIPSALYDSLVWADWSAQDTQPKPVPTPPTLVLMLLSLIGIALKRRCTLCN